MSKEVKYCEYWKLEYDYRKLELEMNICNGREIDELMERYPNGVEIIHDKIDTNTGDWTGEHKFIVEKLIEIRDDWAKRLEMQLEDFKESQFVGESNDNDK